MNSTESSLESVESAEYAPLSPNSKLALQSYQRAQNLNFYEEHENYPVNRAQYQLIHPCDSIAYERIQENQNLHAYGQYHSLVNEQYYTNTSNIPDLSPISSKIF